MKILTLNSWGCRVEEIFSFIREQSKTTDVFCFQEILTGVAGKTSTGAVSNCYEIIKDLLLDYESFTYPYPIEINDLYERVPLDNYKLVMACFVKKDIPSSLVGGTGLLLPNKKWDDYQGHFGAGALQVVRVGDYTIENVHGIWQGSIKTDTEAKLEQSDIVLDFCKDITNKKIICGDFNLMPETEAIAKFEEAGYLNLIKEFNICNTRSCLYQKHQKPLRHANYTFVTKDIEVASFQVPDVAVSDHLPMILEII